MTLLQLSILGFSLSFLQRRFCSKFSPVIHVPCQFSNPEPCAGVSCNVPGETCVNGICKCGSSCSCDNKRTGSYCDSANSQCKCGKDTDSCQKGETCVDGACIRCIGGDSCCTKDKPCGLGEGDCDYDSDCKNDLKCGKDNCKKCEKGTDCGLFDDTDDCCIQP